MAAAVLFCALLCVVLGGAVGGGVGAGRGRRVGTGPVAYPATACAVRILARGHIPPLWTVTGLVEVASIRVRLLTGSTLTNKGRKDRYQRRWWRDARTGTTRRESGT